MRLGMIGGGSGAFIGAVHRRALALDGEAVLVAGALSSDPARALSSARELGLDPARSYPDWQSMLARERSLPPEQRIHAVVIVTPNHAHHAPALAFAQAGFHIICDKPLALNSAQCAELVRAARQAKIIFCVTYNYSGYPMVREARARIAAGELGALRRIHVEYHQGWLSRAIERDGQKQAAWRTDRALSGAGGAIGDIGTHAEHLLRYVTGLEPVELCADLRAAVPGRTLDDDASVLLRFDQGARGVLSASQICFGAENGLNIRAWGERGALAWNQESPNELHLWDDEGERTLRRAGAGVQSPGAAAAARLPSGHPEGFHEAFANVYRGAFAAIRAMHGQTARSAPPHDYPSVEDGARGVWFVERCVASSGARAAWVDARWPGVQP